MKYLIIFPLIFITSCNDNTGKETTTTSEPKLDLRDSSTAKNTAANPFATIDISPMDMAYFPIDYPVQKMSGASDGPPVVRVIYSRPYRQGRTIFGGLVKYGEPWRLGANEATEIEFFQPVSIQNKKVGKNRYVIYCIPNETKWTIVFNSNLYTWGLKPDRTKDVYQFEIDVTQAPETLEYFTMAFEKTATGADLVIAWENVMGRLPLQF